MKLRFTETDIRFRITQEEFDTLLKEHLLTHTLKIAPNQVFQYQLSLIPNLGKMDLSYCNHTLRFKIPYEKYKQLNTRQPLSGQFEKITFSLEIDYQRTAKARLQDM